MDDTTFHVNKKKPKAMENKIRRVKGKDAKLCGVLAGISKHLDPCWDPLIIRLIFLALAALTGFVFMFALYFILALILKVEDPDEDEKACYHRIKRTRGKEARLFGVIGGISKHLDPERDPFLFRVGFLILAALSGFVFMGALYLVLAVLLHREDKKLPEDIGDKDSQ